jgi:hypothetical protein
MNQMRTTVDNEEDTLALRGHTDTCGHIFAPFTKAGVISHRRHTLAN